MVLAAVMAGESPPSTPYCATLIGRIPLRVATE